MNFRETLKRRVPILNWLPSYNKSYLLSDIVAGLTVGLTVIPQGIAYGVIAGLPPQFGLYSAFLGCFIYTIFGTCKDLAIGPTAIMALMVQSNISGSIEYLLLSTFLSGCLIFVLGCLNLGVLVQFISIPVVTGFTSAAAITIASAQVSALFGVPSASNEFYESWVNLIIQFENINWSDAALGICTLVILVLSRKLKDLPCLNATAAKYLNLLRNVFVIVVGILIAYFCTTDKHEPFTITGFIQPGLPQIQLPQFSTTTANGETVNFMDMVRKLGSSLVTIAIIAILEMIAIAKTFAQGKQVDASQEMIAVGLCNIASSFVQSMPITGSFSRSAVNNSSGVQTTFGGVFTGILVILSLAYLTELFYFIPKTSLAAVIIAAMIFMVEYKSFVEIWKAKKSDVVPMVLTFVTCLLLGLEYGIMFGVLGNMLYVMYLSSRPNIAIVEQKFQLDNNEDIALIEIYGDISYSAAECLKEKILNYAQSNQQFLKIVINGAKLSSIDSTVAINLLMLKDDLEDNKKELWFWNWQAGTKEVLRRLSKNIENNFVCGEAVNGALTDKNAENKINFVVECESIRL